MRTTLATRPLTLRVPIANEPERAHFQRRLALTGLVVFVLAGGFFVVALVLVQALTPFGAAAFLSELSVQIHGLTAAIAGAVWLALRRGRRSIALLGFLDVAVSAGICLGWTSMALSGIPIVQRPEMIALLAMTYTLVLRAALIPSTPARTAVLGVLSLVPLVVMTKFLYPRSGGHAAHDRSLPPMVDVAMWGVLGTAATTVISHVIYGLRQEVRKAMQLGQYVLDEKIGEGGMGIVYRASHAMLRRPTAIKLLPGSSASAAERFEREVQITARLTHPNTIAVFDYGRTPDGIFYYAMEYVGGMSLDDLIAIDGPQPPRRVVHLLLQVCGALAEAHAAGLVHRDIKPANLMLTERGGVHDVVKVLDFGLVKEISGFGKDAPAENAVLGTPHFMAPEAILDPAGIDGRADLYALGATAYYLLTGTHVFDGKDVVAVCSQHLHDLPEPPSRRRDLPASLERVILACLEKKADARPRDAAALAVDLRACALGEWTEEEARGWWDAPRSDRATPREGALSATNVDAFGTTMEIALDDRVA